jgi:hypothetical protein
MKLDFSLNVVNGTRVRTVPVQKVEKRWLSPIGLLQTFV